MLIAEKCALCFRSWLAICRALARFIPKFQMNASVQAGRDRARLLVMCCVHWLVYELTEQYDRRGPSLVFESENMVRRVRAYPEDWRRLNDEDLVRVMERA